MSQRCFAPPYRAGENRSRNAPGRSLAGLAMLALLSLAATLLPAAPHALAAEVSAQGGAPMRMKVGTDNPLLLTQLNIGNDLGKTDGFVRNYNSGWSIAQLQASVPDDVKNNMGFVPHQGHTALSDKNPDMSAEWLEANVAEANAVGVPIFILWDEGRTLISNQTKWQFLEHLYATYPKFVVSSSPTCIRYST